MGIEVNIWGNSSSDAILYGISKVGTETISNAKWNELYNNIVAERARRGVGSFSNPVTSPITAYRLNTLASAITVWPSSLGSFTDRFGYSTTPYIWNGDAWVTYYENGVAIGSGPGGNKVPSYFSTIGPYYGNYSDVYAGLKVTAAQFNSVIDKLNASGSYCVCNCNYCTCNCNYCTCNCNYSCTCNCNY